MWQSLKATLKREAYFELSIKREILIQHFKMSTFSGQSKMEGFRTAGAMVTNWIRPDRKSAKTELMKDGK